MDFSVLVCLGAVTLSFLTYGLGSVSIVNFHIVGWGTIFFLSLGVMFEAIAIVLGCIHGSYFDIFHHFIFNSLAVTSFLAMFLTVFWAWKQILSKGFGVKVGKTFITYVKVSWGIWSIIYFSVFLVSVL